MEVDEFYGTSNEANFNRANQTSTQDRRALENTIGKDGHNAVRFRHDKDNQGEGTFTAGSIQAQSNEAIFKQELRRATENEINPPTSLSFATSRNNNETEFHNKGLSSHFNSLQNLNWPDNLGKRKCVSTGGIICNCRGTKSTTTVRELRQMCKIYHADFLFLFDSKSNEEDIKKLTRKLNFVNQEVVPARRHAEGLALLWQESLNSIVIVKDNWLMHCIIDDCSLYGLRPLSNAFHTLMKNLNSRAYCMTMERSTRDNG